MTTQAAQANPQSTTVEASGSEAPKPSRIQEFIASLNDPAEAAEFRKHATTLLQEDFTRLDKSHQKRYSDLQKEHQRATAALADLADAEVLSRYQQESGSLEKAKARLVKSGIPAWYVRSVKTFDDLWEAEDDFRKGAGLGTATNGTGTENAEGVAAEDKAFAERIQRLFPSLANGGQPRSTDMSIVPGGGAPASNVTITSDNADALYLEGKISSTQYNTFLQGRGVR